MGFNMLCRLQARIRGRIPQKQTTTIKSLYKSTLASKHPVLSEQNFTSTDPRYLHTHIRSLASHTPQYHSFNRKSNSSWQRRRIDCAVSRDSRTRYTTVTSEAPYRRKVQRSRDDAHVEKYWKQAIKAGRGLVHTPTSLVTFKMLTQWRAHRTALQYMMHLMWAGHPLYYTLKDCLFQRNGHAFRPVIVLLMGRAVQTASESSHTGEGASAKQIAVKHQELAALTEMMFVGSLIHTDIVDVSRAADPALLPPLAAPGNKISVLTGDFLLSKSSVMLAKLQSARVVRVMSHALAQLSEGGARKAVAMATAQDVSVTRQEANLRKHEEVSTPGVSSSCQQLAREQTQTTSHTRTKARAQTVPSIKSAPHMSLDTHMHTPLRALSTVGTEGESVPDTDVKVQTIAGQDNTNSLYDKDTRAFVQGVYLSTGSLIANSCKAVAILAGAAAEVEEMAFLYGKHLGIAYQLHREVADTRFAEVIDDLIGDHCERAQAAIHTLHESPAKSALIDIAKSLELS